MTIGETIFASGGRPLSGEINISGSKNACLPLMLLPMLTDEECVFDNVPLLADVSTLRRLLSYLGGDIKIEEKRGARQGYTMHLRFTKLVSDEADYSLVSKMRASFWVISALVSRLGTAKVAMPGGCNLGQRPIDYILDSIKALGGKVRKHQGYVLVSTENGLKGNKIVFKKASVGATHCAIIAAVLAQGITEIHNAACEPEVTAVAQCLVAMGAQISGIGTKNLIIKGVKKLHGVRFSVPPDRIETGSYAILFAATGVRVCLHNAEAQHLDTPLRKLEEAGVDIEVEGNTIKIERDIAKSLRAVDIKTEVYPGFPTDLQAQFMTLMGLAQGRSTIHETIYENRFMHVPELLRFGAEIQTIDQNTAIVDGVNNYVGAQVKATDLRASKSLIIAALVAKGHSRIHDIYHLDRGFEDLEKKLTQCGAIIRREGGVDSLQDSDDLQINKRNASLL